MACREGGTRRWVQRIKMRRKKKKEEKQNKPKTPKDRAYISTKKRESNKERKQKNIHELKKAKHPQKSIWGDGFRTKEWKETYMECW